MTKEPKHEHQANNCLLVVVYVVGALDAKTRFNLMSSLSIKSTKLQLIGLCHAELCSQGVVVPTCGLHYEIVI